MSERHRRGGERLLQKAPKMFDLLQRLYDKLTRKHEIGEESRVEVRDLLESIDHVERE